MLTAIHLHETQIVIGSYKNQLANPLHHSVFLFQTSFEFRKKLVVKVIGMHN